MGVLCILIYVNQNNLASNLCQNITCKNTGICNVVSSNHSECFCPTGYGGNFCELVNSIALFFYLNGALIF